MTPCRGGTSIESVYVRSGARHCIGILRHAHGRPHRCCGNDRNAGADTARAAKVLRSTCGRSSAAPTASEPGRVFTPLGHCVPAPLHGLRHGVRWWGVFKFAPALPGKRRSSGVVIVARLVAADMTPANLSTTPCQRLVRHPCRAPGCKFDVLWNPRLRRTTKT